MRITTDRKTLTDPLYWRDWAEEARTYADETTEVVAGSAGGLAVVYVSGAPSPIRSVALSVDLHMRQRRHFAVVPLSDPQPQRSNVHRLVTNVADEIVSAPPAKPTPQPGASALDQRYSIRTMGGQFKQRKIVPRRGAENSAVRRKFLDRQAPAPGWPANQGPGRPDWRNAGDRGAA